MRVEDGQMVSCKAVGWGHSIKNKKAFFQPAYFQLKLSVVLQPVCSG